MTGVTGGDRGDATVVWQLQRPNCGAVTVVMSLWCCTSDVTSAATVVLN